MSHLENSWTFGQPKQAIIYLSNIGVNHGGTGRDCPIQSFDWGTTVLTVPPKA